MGPATARLFGKRVSNRPRTQALVARLLTFDILTVKVNLAIGAKILKKVDCHAWVIFTSFVFEFADMGCFFLSLIIQPLMTFYTDDYHFDKPLPK